MIASHFFEVQKFRQETNDLGVGFRYAKELKQRKVRKHAQINLTDTHSFLPITECTFLADKGYDVKKIYNQVHALYNGECIIPLNKRNTKDTKLLPIGVPVCEAGLAMHRDGRCFDCNRVKQKFCCPFKLSGTCPVDHVKFHNGKKNRGCTKWITIPNDLRLSIDRNSQYFKFCYSLCTECEPTTHALKIRDRNACGYGISNPLQTSIQLPTSAFWLLPLQPSPCQTASHTGS